MPRWSRPWPRCLRATARLPLVVDPVMVATSGDMLLAAGRDRGGASGELMPLAGADHAQPAGGRAPARERRPPRTRGRRAGAGRCSRLGCGRCCSRAGMAAARRPSTSSATPAGIERLVRPRIDTPHTHGTGCTLSAAIAALLAQGIALQRRWSAPRTSCGRRWRPAERSASAMGPGRSITCSPSAACRRRLEAAQAGASRRDELGRVPMAPPRRGSSCDGTSAAPRRLDRGNVDLLHVHHRIKCALCFIAAGRQRLGQDARRDLPGNAPLVLAPAALRSPGRHCRRWRSNSGRSLADRRWRSGTRRLRCV